MCSHAVHTVHALGGAKIYFETHGDPTRPAILLGPHFYRSNRGLNERWIGLLQPHFYLVTADYPPGIGDTSLPQTDQSASRSFDAEVAAIDYANIAKAASLERFGWLGYSFGGALGLQVAARIPAISALAIGGFPPLNAPYAELAAISRTIAAHPPELPSHVGRDALWNAVTFYEKLLGSSERVTLTRISARCLAYMGDRDAAQGLPTPIPLAEQMRSAEGELRALGWSIRWLEGHDHVSALDPEISAPTILRFFFDVLG